MCTGTVTFCLFSSQILILTHIPCVLEEMKNVHMPPTSVTTEYKVSHFSKYEVLNSSHEKHIHFRLLLYIKALSNNKLGRRYVNDSFRL